MKICFTTLGCPDWTIEQVCKKAEQWNADGVELRAKLPDLHVSTETPKARVKEIRRMFEDSGVAIVGITGYTHFADSSVSVRRENEDQLVRNLELCAELGADYVRSFIGYPDIEESDDVYRYIGESLRRACLRASDISAMALIETHDFASSGQSTRRMLDYAGSDVKNLGAIWDISHPPKKGEAPEKTWELIGHAVRSVHIKDEYAERLPNGEIHQCFPGLGVLPLRRVLEILHNAQYNGYYVVEWERAFNMNLAPLEDAFFAFRDYLLEARKSFSEG